jgi:non-homologous end joining protein Ku
MVPAPVVEEIDGRYVELARTLMEADTLPFGEASYPDRGTKALRDLIAAGKPAKAPAAAPVPVEASAKLMDLTKALEEAVKAAKGRHPTTPRAPRKPAAKKVAARPAPARKRAATKSA